MGRNLALGIYTAVANPVSLEGRHLLCSSALLHEDLSAEVGALGVPVVLLQSTEDVLVNPANVDPFLRGRSSTHHFWSHEFRDGGDGGGGGCTGSDGEAPSAAAVSGSSVYGSKGLTDLLRALSKPRGTFVAWVRAGHEVCQESKRAVIDLLDALAKPTPEHTGVDESRVIQGEAEGAVTLGLYPSGEWVARVNKWGGDREAGGENADHRSPVRSAATHEEPGQAVDTNGSGGDDAAILFERGRREKRAPVERDGDDINHGLDPKVGVVTTTASPFPTDISIPTLPANIAYRHRVAPNTSPIKESNAATSSTAATSPGGGRQARSVDAFGFAAAEGSERAGGGRGCRRGRRRVGGPLDAHGRGSQAVRDPLVVEHGGRCRPKVVWKDTTPLTSTGGDRGESANKARPKEDEAGRDCERRGGDYSSSYFPTAALVYDDGPPRVPSRGAACGERVTRPSLSLNDASLNKSAVTVPVPHEEEEDPRDLVKNLPSLEFETAGQLQRGNRQWVVTKTRNNINGGHEDVGGSETSPTSPASSSKTTAATAGTTTSTLGGSDALGDLLVAEASLESRLCEARGRAAGRLVREAADAERRIAGITEDQRARSRAFAEEDRKMIAELEAQLAVGRLARAPVDLQRAVDGVDLDDAILQEGLIPPRPSLHSTHGRDDAATSSETGGAAGGDSVDAFSAPCPVRPMPPLDYCPLDDLPEELQRATDTYSVMDDAARDEKEMLRIRKAAGGGGAMNLEQFQRDQAKAASEAAAWRLTTKKAFRKRSESDLHRAREEAVLRFQPIARGVLSRKRARRLRLERDEEQKYFCAATKVQSMVRVLIAKGRACTMREAAIAEIVLGGSAIRLQSVGRGMMGRRRAARRRRQAEARTIQRCYRGHLGRRSAAHQRALLEQLKRKNQSAVKVQAWWRAKRTMDRYARVRASSIAAVEIQRVYRGVIGRKKASRRLQWAQSEPGPERLKLGVRLIEDSKVRTYKYNAIYARSL